MMDATYAAPESDLTSRGGDSCAAESAMSNTWCARNLKFLGNAFHIYAPDGSLTCYSKLKAFKLKEDIRVYADEAMDRELLVIKARSVIDFGATYDVEDAGSGEKLGAFRRKGLKSLLQDEWAILNLEDEEVGTIKEDSLMLALVRRLLSNLVPQHFTVKWVVSLRVFSSRTSILLSARSTWIFLWGARACWTAAWESRRRFCCVRLRDGRADHRLRGLQINLMKDIHPNF